MTIPDAAMTEAAAIITAMFPPTSPRLTYGQPDFKPAATPDEIADLAQESGCPPEDDPASAGWDISYGCRLNYGHSPDGPLVVDIQLGPDYDGTGVIRRTVTPEQLVEHAQYLLAVADAEIDDASSTIKVEYASLVYLDGQPTGDLNDLIWLPSPTGPEARRDWHLRRAAEDPTWKGEARVLRRLVVTTEPKVTP